MIFFYRKHNFFTLRLFRKDHNERNHIIELFQIIKQFSIVNELNHSLSNNLIIQPQLMV